jgi:primosomal protein N'
MELGLFVGAEAGEGRPTGQQSVEVAVDAPGASRTYDYAVPDRLAPMEAGEAVLVEFGRSRQALGVVLGPSSSRSWRGSTPTGRWCRR